MNNSDQPLDLAALRAAEAAMTPGEWQTRFIFRMLQCARLHERSDGMLYGEDNDWEDSVGIVAMRNAFPALLDEVERLREEAEWLRKSYDLYVKNASKEVERLRRECDAQQKMLDAAGKSYSQMNDERIALVYKYKALQATIAAIRAAMPNDEEPDTSPRDGQ